ncbi:hypothetical protein J2R71_000249 [Bradyrhizobium japonicum]|nr:hypothetical protein [Bradyrhizobium japonicum]
MPISAHCRLAGSWQADKGIDINPKAEGPERRTFIERIRMDPIDPQANGPQLFYGLRYHIHINTPEEDITFHDQVGYWLWEPATGLIMQTLAIPRGQVLLASGKAAPDDRKISVTAKRGDTAYGICSTDFLEQAFRTDSYRCDITFNDDGSWSYLIRTELFGARRAVQPSRQQHAQARRAAQAQSAGGDREGSRRARWISGLKRTRRIA